MRRAFTIRLRPGGFLGWKQHHDEIWSDLVAEIGRSGIGQITIFHDESATPDGGSRLFVYSEIASDSSWEQFWASDVYARWGRVMDEFMELESGGAPNSSTLTEAFHLDTRV